MKFWKFFRQKKDNKAQAIDIINRVLKNLEKYLKIKNVDKSSTESNRVYRELKDNLANIQIQIKLINAAFIEEYKDKLISELESLEKIKDQKIEKLNKRDSIVNVSKMVLESVKYKELNNLAKTYKREEKILSKQIELLSRMITDIQKIIKLIYSDEKL